jgi:hypothetical protein
VVLEVRGLFLTAASQRQAQKQARRTSRPERPALLLNIPDAKICGYSGYSLVDVVETPEHRL